MTPKQRTNFYIPKWLAVAKAFDWVMVGGRLLGDMEAQHAVAPTLSPVACELVREIIGRAQRLAVGEQRAVTADDLRHAINQVASRGRTHSATKLTNAELNEFDRICNVLRNPIEDLNTTIPFVNKEEDDRRRAIQYLNKLSYEAQLRAISERAFDTREWETLEKPKLDWMIQTVKASSSHRRFAAAQPF